MDNTEFREYLNHAVQELGAGKVSRILGIDQRTIHRWRTGEITPRRHTPAQVVDALEDYVDYDFSGDL